MTATSSATRAPSISTEDSRQDRWNRVMTASPGDLDVRVSPDAIEGVIPASLRGGRLLSIGPGWTAIDGWIAHPFDGHGYLRSYAFDPDGGLSLRARFVRTEVFVEEQKAKRMVRRGLGSNVGRRFWQNLGIGLPRNVANTTVVRWAGKLLAGWEGGAPHALRPDSLETLGEEHFGGAIAGQATLAHMHHDAVAKRLLLCSMKNGPTVGLHFRELDGHARVVQQREAKLKGPIFAHDFAFTEHWYVVGGNPLRMKLPELAKMMLGSSTLLRSLGTDKAASGMLYLIPRRGDGPVRAITLPTSSFVVHFGNAFERDGAVFVDACTFGDFEFGNEFGYTGPESPLDPSIPDRRAPQRLMRIEVRQDNVATWRPLVPHGVDFPRVHPYGEGTDVPVMFGASRADKRHSDPFDSVLRADLRDLDATPQLWTADEDVFVGEPIFVPASRAPNTTAGHVLVVTSDGRRAGPASRLVILDAEHVAAGPVASIALPLLPVAFHGEWDPGA